MLQDDLSKLIPFLNSHYTIVIRMTLFIIYDSVLDVTIIMGKEVVEKRLHKL